MKICRLLLSALSAAALVCNTPALRAATIYWDGSASNSWATAANFNTAVNETGVDIAAGTGAHSVVFTVNDGGLNLNTNLAANRSIYTLTYNGNIVAPSTIANNVLTIIGQASAGITLGATSADHTITSTITVGTAASNQIWTVPTGRLLTVAAVNDPTVGDSNVTLVGGGTILLTASGSVNKWDVRGSTLKLNGSGRLGDTTTSVDLNSTATLDFTNPANDSANFSDAWRGLNGAVGSTVLNYGTSTANVNLDLRPQAANEVYRFSGTFVNASPLGSLIMQGVTTFGTQIIEANYPGANNLQVLNGNLVLGNVNGAANQAIASIVIGRADASTQPAGTANMLVLDSSLANHSAQNRLHDLENILMRSNGQFKVIGNAAAATTETIGPIRSEISNTIHPHSIITLQDGGQGVQVNSVVLEHNARTTLLVRGNGLGSGALGPGVTQLKFATSPLQVAGTGAQQPVIPYLVGDNSPTGAGTDFVTDDTNGLRLLTAGEYASSLNSGIPSNVNLTANAATAGSSTDLALKLSGGVALNIGADDTVTINSGRISSTGVAIQVAGGAILSVGASPNTITGGKLTFGVFGVFAPVPAAGPHEGYIHAVQALNLNTTITNNGTSAVSLSKSGAGLLTISQPQTYTGESTFTEGNVSVTGANFLPAGRTSISNTLFLSGAPSDSVGNIAGHLGSILNIGATTSLNIKGGADSTWWGTVVGTAGPVALTKSGAGIVTIRSVTGTSVFNGAPLTVAGGGLTFFEAGPTASASPSVTIRGGGTLTLNNGTANNDFFNQNRIGNGAPITINRGTFVITGSNNARVQEDVGGITIDTALAFFTIDADDGTTATVTSSTQGDVILQTPSLIRLNKGTIYVRGELGQNLAGRPDGLGVGLPGVPDTTGAEGAFRVTGGVQLSHSPNNFGTTTAAIVPWGTAALGSGAAAATASGLLTYDPGDGDSGTAGVQHIGFRPLAANEYATVAAAVPSTVAAALVLNQNARFTWNGPSSVIAPINLVAPTTVRGLVLNNTSTSASDLRLNGNLLTVESGVIVSIGTADNEIIGGAGGQLTFGPNDATGYEGRIDGLRRIDINVPIVDNGINPVSVTIDNVVYYTVPMQYTGETQINSGRLEIEAVNVLPLNTVLTVADTAELRLNNQDQEIRGLQGAGFVGNENNTPANDSTFTINVPVGETYDFSGTMRNRSVFTFVEGGLRLIKKGPGTQILSGVNTMTGDSVGGVSGNAAIVQEGTLIVNGSIAGRVNNDPNDLLGNVQVLGDITKPFENRGILGGTGLVSGEVAISGYGTLAPGFNGVGTLTIGSLNMDGPVTGVEFNLTLPGVIGGGINDLVNVVGDIAVDGFLAVFAGPGFGQGVYRLFNYGGSRTTSRQFKIDDFYFDFQAFPGSFVDYSTPGQINLVVVPEPASALALVGGAGLLLGLRRRRS